MIGQKYLYRVPILLLLVAIAVFAVINHEDFSPLLYHTLRGKTAHYTANNNIYIPPSLDEDKQRTLSLNLGGGACKWQPPNYEVPESINFHKTFITGFPSGDKRMVYLQMEALAGFSAKDEWDFAYAGMTNHPFIKGNYPHHEGIWGWGTVADQVVMMVPNIRRSMVEYHDILWDLGYATTWEDATLLSDNLYEDLPTTDDYHEWRDSRVLDEARWYGWFIDYWMEGGLMRDIFTHKLTTEEHWDDLLLKPFYSRTDLDYDNYVSAGTVIPPTYDPHCARGDISGGCEPVAVISADKLLDYTEGAGETSAIASALMNDSRTGQYVIAPEAWDCIWDELIKERKGPKIMADRPGYQAIDGYNFSSEMLEEMLDELDRLITKYSGGIWSSKLTAQRLVEILVEHRASIQVELNEVHTGVRKLRDTDFLGPTERIRRRDLKRKEKTDMVLEAFPEKKDHSRYFIALQQERFETKRREMKGVARRNNEENINRVESDGELIGMLSDTLAQIRTLEAAGGMDHDTAISLADSVEDVGEAIIMNREMEYEEKTREMEYKD